MNSKDDDTLPLPGFSEELSVDVTADEDFIPTSQPHSTGSPKVSRISDSSANKSSEEPNFVADSRIDDTLPPEAVINRSALDKDKSTDFIPDTETKKTVMNHGNDFSCKKKLTVGIFKTESNSLWGAASTNQIPESPALENVSILNDTPTTILPSEVVKEVEESITEIIVNDSAETVDLEVTPSNSTTEPRVVEVSHSEAERCEDTQIFDNSVLLLEQPNCANTGEPSLETVNDNQANIVNESQSEAVVTPPEASIVKEEIKNFPVKNPRPEEPSQSNPPSESNSQFIVTRKIDFKLTVSAMVTFNTKTNEIIEKLVKSVTETPRPKPVYVELPSDTASDKSKRHSTSSSGSVYSDKPFALPKRLSGVSNMTDSSEEDFFHSPKKERRNRERIPWRREFLLPLKLDDLLTLTFESGDLVKKPIDATAQQKFRYHKIVTPLEEIVESSTSLQTTTAIEELKSEVKSTALESNKAKEGSNGESLDTNLNQEDKHLKENMENKEDESVIEEPEAESNEQNIEPTSGRLMEGISVFARWSDKRYYSGVLRGSVRNDRWDVMFDDGTAKTVREDFLMPSEWVKVGALVFAMVDDKYESGQVADIKRGEETNYVVELDAEKREISVHLSDLCLTEVMAGIIREKYKPHAGTPRGKAEIDFDNVVSGKRLREQRTPLKPVTTQQGGSGSKKSSTKNKRSGLGSIKETPEERKSTGKKIGGLKTENGHLVQDKIISTESPSGTDADETPLRRNSVSKRKGKPRSLSYEEGPRSGKKKQKNWLAPDGTPVPGPSGVKFKKQKSKPKTNEGENSPSISSKQSPGRLKAPPSTENKRKRKLNESVEDPVQKKQMKDEGKINTRKRKG